MARGKSNKGQSRSFGKRCYSPVVEYGQEWFSIGGSTKRKARHIMIQLTRITMDPQVMGGKPCIRGLRVTVGTLVGLMAAGHSIEDILRAYPYLEEEDIRQALAYAAWRAE